MRAHRLIEAALTFAGNLLFPRLSHRLRWRTRLGLGGTLAYVLAWIVFGVSFMWFMSKVARRHDEMWAEVREHLRREQPATRSSSTSRTKRAEADFRAQPLLELLADGQRSSELAPGYLGAETRRRR